VVAQVTKGWNVSVRSRVEQRGGRGEFEGPWLPGTDAAKRRAGGKRQKPFD